MKAQNFKEAKLMKKGYYLNDLNEIKNRSEYPIVDMPKNFWFKIYNDRLQIHFAFIVEEDNEICVFFSNAKGQVFDKLKYKNKKIAKRLLRKNKFVSSSNKKCPYIPAQPLYKKLMSGRKTAPYSVGNLWIPQERYKNINYKIELRKISKVNLVLLYSIIFIISIIFIFYFILGKCYYLIKTIMG